MLKRAIIIVLAIVLFTGMASFFPTPKAQALPLIKHVSLVQEPWTLLTTFNDSIISRGGGCPDFTSSPPPGTLNGAPAWYRISIPLSAYMGKTVYIAFFFDTLDGGVNKYQGWFVRDVNFGNNALINYFLQQTRLWNVCGSGNGPVWHPEGGIWHYANPSTNNYQGNPIHNSCSDTANWGALVSPPILVAGSSTLNFTTKWQIEGDEPSLYDLMQVYLAVGRINQAPACPKPSINGTIGIFSQESTTGNNLEQRSWH